MSSALDEIKEGRSSVYKLRRQHLDTRKEADTGRNPRNDFGDIEGLAQSIARHGIQSPLTGSMEGKTFMVGHGERRLAAYDFAVKNRLPSLDGKPFNPKGDLGLIPVKLEGLPSATADRDRLILHVVLNEGKPLNQFEKGIAMDRLMKEHQLDEKTVAEHLGYSVTAVRDCLRLVNGASEGVQAAVQDGKLSPTAAIELVREVPDKGSQDSILEKGIEAAEKEGKERVTAKHLPVETGKAAQQSRRRGATPFDGKESTPDSVMSNANGEYVENTTSCQIPLTHKRVKATVITALVGATYHIGWRINWPGKAKGDGFLLVHPSTKGLTADTEDTAILLGLHQIRAEIEAKDFDGKPKVLEELDQRMNHKAAEIPPPPATPSIANPVIKPTDRISELKEVVTAIEAKDAEKDRLKTAKNVLQFLRGKMEAKDLVKFIMGID
jgi:ParB-like chromosome segregation protein Spo0J